MLKSLLVKLITWFYSPPTVHFDHRMISSWQKLHTLFNHHGKL